MISQNGIVFDLHRFSIHDGPGIRTTIFLKGCSLKCTWCHNPESQDFKPQLSFNSEKCINCLECTKVCPNGAHTSVNGIHYLNWALCDTQGKCVDVCVSNALKIAGAETTVGELVQEVAKDKKYFQKTGGGVTISGGEPLAQFKFTYELLQQLKQSEINTCIDTCGFAKQEYYEEILPYTDLFLFDYKLTDNNIHKLYTGVKNNKILKNLDFLYNSGASIILRCPVIPGINDTEDHFNGIKMLMHKYPGLRSVELMPYHNMGRDKAARIGRQYALKELKNTDDQVKQNWLSFFRKDNYEVICN